MFCRWYNIDYSKWTLFTDFSGCCYCSQLWLELNCKKRKLVVSMKKDTLSWDRLLLYVVDSRILNIVMYLFACYICSTRRESFNKSFVRKMVYVKFLQLDSYNVGSYELLKAGVVYPWHYVSDRILGLRILQHRPFMKSHRKSNWNLWITLTGELNK